MFELLVVVTPTGPLYIAINTSRTINCSLPDGGLFISWYFLFQNGSIGHEYPGIMFTRTQTSSSLTINTTDRSIISLVCRGLLSINSDIEIATRINLTIFYGMLVKFFITLY